MLLKCLSICSQDALAHKRLHFCLISEVCISHAVLDELALGQRPQPLNWVQMARVRRIVQKHLIVLPGFVGHCWVVVGLEVVHEDVGLLLVHASAELDQELDEAADLDRLLLEQQSHHAALDVDCCDHCNCIETQFLLGNLEGLIACSGPVPGSDLSPREDCFVHEDDVLPLLDKPD